jgi:MFS family permease
LGNRYDARKLLLGGTLTWALASLALAVDALSSPGNFALVLTLAALGAGVGGFTAPIRPAAIVGEPAGEQLLRAYSLNQIIVNMSSVAVPSIAGVLLAAVSMSPCYFADDVRFLILASATLFVTPLAAPARRAGVALFHAIGVALMAWGRQTFCNEAV